MVEKETFSFDTSYITVDNETTSPLPRLSWRQGNLLINNTEENQKKHDGYYHYYDNDKDNNDDDQDAESIKKPSNFRELLKINYDKFSVNFGEDNVENGDKYLVYRCDSRSMSHCGGWADRIKGIMAGYMIANLTGRTFKAEIKTHGCDLMDYILPNRVNWSLSRSFHKDVIRNHDVQILSVIDRREFYNDISGMDFKKCRDIQSKFVYFKANLDYNDGFKSNKIHAQQLSWMTNLTRDQIAGTIYRRLFKLPPPLQKQLDSFLEASLRSPSEKLICAHIRMGRNPSIPGDSAIRNDPSVLPKVWRYINSASLRYKSVKVFVMSDSQTAIEDAKKQDFSERLILIPGRIVHIEKSRGVEDKDLCQQQAKVVLEQSVLMHCDELMISKSGLSRMAAYVRGSDVGLFCLVSGEVIPCKLSGLKELYRIIG